MVDVTGTYSNRLKECGLLKMIELSDGKCRLELNVIANDGDAVLGIFVNSMGFSGCSDSYILNAQLRKFCMELAELQRTLKGKAVLTSLVPEELLLTIEPFGSRGHLSVVGKFGYSASTTMGDNWHGVEFGFEIEPQQLDKAVRVSWVRKCLSW